MVALPISDEELVQKCLRRDNFAYNTLFSRYYKDGLRFAKRLVDNPCDAEDVVQESFMKVCMYANTFNPSNKLKTWLFTIIKNTAIDFFRVNGKHTRLSLDRKVDESKGEDNGFINLRADKKPSFQNQREESAEETELRLGIKHLMQRYKTGERNFIPLYLYSIMGLSYEQISNDLQIPLGTVKSQIHKARGLLEELVRDERKYLAAAA